MNILFTSPLTLQGEGWLRGGLIDEVFCFETPFYLNTFDHDWFVADLEFIRCERETFGVYSTRL